MLNRQAAAADALIVFGISKIQTRVHISHSGTQIGKFRSFAEPGLTSPGFCTLGSRSRAVRNEGFGAEKGDSD